MGENRIMFKRIKTFFKDRFRSKNWYVEELEKRLKEVINRAQHIAKRTFPDWLLDKPFNELIYWVIEPHIKIKWIPYIHTKPEEDRGAERAVFKIMELRQKLDQKENKKRE